MLAHMISWFPRSVSQSFKTVTIFMFLFHFDNFSDDKISNFLFSAEVPLRVSGRMEKDMDWESKREEGGCTEETGHKDSRGAMGSDSRPRRMPNMKVPGPTDCKMATDPKPMLTVVNI